VAVFSHHQLPIHDVPRIKTRILVGEGSGAESTTVWEQWIHVGGYIPLHYHEEEEALVLLAGRVSLTMAAESSSVLSPSTILIPPQVVHGLTPEGNEQVHLIAFFPVASPKIFAPDGTLRPMPWEDRRSPDG
jgi:quercetin dioxygenase-like cupin family protein